ncbi:NAD(P)H-dependent glycerol-3-phosphate dehydrogenase [Dongshaea marina]|uniref:NAD(P)H-dependent glycerol-3-phosphate dehydrogenase n=1 Tax=Dongshaea marina TaxID=2047966 RepID=UPI000D3EB8D4|nr:NAD(P)H-dependent glycerol-3-phosphate dehydrogenase [Dongshaea marina]
MSADITVIGAGSYGTALAIAAARAGNNTVLWGHESDHMARLAEERCNQEFLPGVPFPDNLQIESDLATAVAASRDLLIVVPSHVFGEVLRRIEPLLREDSRIAWATKGLDPEGRLLHELALEILGPDRPIAVLSGPTFAKELAAGLPTAIALAASDEAFRQHLSDLMHDGRALRVYTSKDMIGLQLGGAVKNVIAIAAGLSDGLGFGANARTALITRGLVEIARLGEALGAEARSFHGMSGLGDLVLTCTDNQSRNRRFGLALGQGKTPEQAMEEIGQVVEGYLNTKEVHLSAERAGIDMPICEQLYQVLYQGKSPQQAALDLLSRDKKGE